jgi:hypothetical protein
MPHKFVVKDIGPTIDGEYDFDAGTLTYRDFRTIKRISGIRRGEIEDALIADDTDAVLALAIVTLQHHGKVVDEEMLLDNTLGTVQLVLEAPEPDPPLLSPADGESANDESQSDSSNSSGDDTQNSSESQANGRSLTGTPSSDTSATYESLTSPR